EQESAGSLREASLAVASAVIGDDRRVSRANHPVDDRWRCLAALQMIAHGGNRHFRYQELREAPFFGAVPAEDRAGASQRTFLHAPGHFGYPLTQLLGPRACDKIFSIENKQQTCFRK